MLFRLTGPADDRRLRVNIAERDARTDARATRCCPSFRRRRRSRHREVRHHAGTGLGGEEDGDDSRMDLKPPQLGG